jgi:hypothetical protein
MGCKAQTAAIAQAMARICNAADRPKPGCAGREGVIQRFPKYIGTNPDKYSLNIWQLTHEPPKHENELKDPTLIKDGQPHQTILRASRQEVMDRWNAAVGAIEALNAKTLITRPSASAEKT